MSQTLRNALARQKLKQAEESLRQFSGRLLQLQDEERRRIGRELHDGSAQDLVVLAAKLAQLKRRKTISDGRARKLVCECGALAEQCVREIRTFSYLLHPPLLDEFGLEDAIRHYVQGFSQRSGISVGLEVPQRLARLKVEVELALFRVVQECLTNVHRHSRSPSAKIRIELGPSQITLEVSDEGRGITAADPKCNRTSAAVFGVGIPSMRERMKQLGGRLEVDSSRRGTRIRALVPLNGRPS